MHSNIWEAWRHAVHYIDSSIQQMLTSQEDTPCIIWIIYSAKVSSKQLGELRTGHTMHKNDSYPGKMSWKQEI